MSTHSFTSSPSAPRTSTLMLAALGALALAAVVLAIVLSTNGSSNSTAIGRATPSQVATQSRALSLEPGVVQNASLAARTATSGADLATQPGVARFSVPGHEH